MVFIKVQKNKAYFKRYQVKFRRRREGKTDYYARVRLIRQDKNKYNSPKYRFVVRFTNKDVITQVIYSKLVGDFVVASAYGHELTKYGVSLGHTNFAAAYCTGLLCARRLLTKYSLQDKYTGNTEVDGDVYHVEALEDEGEPRPFRAHLDVGLKRTTTGSRIFAAVKGFADGGVDIPHNEKRFPGYDREGKASDPEVMKAFIMGGNVAEFMRYLEEEDPARYKKQFSRYVKAGIKADDIEGIYAKAHAAIRKDPVRVRTAKKVKEGEKAKSYARKRLSYAQRMDRVKQKIEARLAKAEAE